LNEENETKITGKFQHFSHFALLCQVHLYPLRPSLTLSLLYLGRFMDDFLASDGGPVGQAVDSKRGGAVCFGLVSPAIFGIWENISQTIQTIGSASNIGLTRKLNTMA
jgi:hypothetical protein